MKTNTLKTCCTDKNNSLKKKKRFSLKAAIFRRRINAKLNHRKIEIPFTIAEVFVLLLLPVLRLNLIYLALVLLITFTLKYFRFQTFRDFGFRTIEIHTAVIAAAIGIIFGLLDNVYVAPYISSLLGHETELGGYSDVKGSLPGLIGFLLLGWIVGGLFEEYFFRGYIFSRLQSIVKNESLFKLVAILSTSVAFALAHSYQGISGMVGCFYFSVILGLLYFRFNRNVWYLVLIHGMYDTVGIIMLYLGL